jgi:hypothetical protein
MGSRIIDKMLEQGTVLYITTGAKERGVVT